MTERAAMDAYWAVSPETRRMPSSQFRVAYVGLEEPVAVTALGRVIGYYIPVGPAPRSAQQEPSIGSDGSFSRGAGLTEASDGSLADSGASTPPRPAKGNRAGTRGRPAAGSRKPPAATMTQAERDAVLRRVNRSGSER